MTVESGSAWPMVARDDEFRRALAALDGGPGFQGVALVGESGVGKSTLARALADTVKSAGRTVRFVLGTQTGCTVPLGAFSRSVTVGVAYEPAVMLAAAFETLGQEENLVVVVDDAQLLDPLSATLVQQLAVRGTARLIMTIRSGEAVPDPLTALLKERLLLNLHVDAFTCEQTGELATTVLGDAVKSRVVDELYRRTAGNLLLLRGLLVAGRESGVLVRTEEGWQLHGPLRADRELYDLLEFRLRSLTPEELEAVEVLATGELLDWEVLRGLCNVDAVARLERRGLIQLVADGSDTVARLIHPVLGEAAIRHAGVVRSCQLNGVLAQAFQSFLQSDRRRLRTPDVRGQIRLAQFMMRSDLAPDLDVIISAAASAVTMSNLTLAAELARFAFDRGGGLPAAMVLAEALGWQGRGEEVEAVLGDAEPDGGDSSLMVHWGCLRAANLYFGCGQVQPARQLLVEVRDRVDPSAQVDLVTAMEATFACFSGDVPTAIDRGLPLCTADVEPLAGTWAVTSTCWALTFAGRFGDVERVAEVARAAGLAHTGPYRFVMGLAGVLAAVAAGDCAGAEAIWESYAQTITVEPEAGAFERAMLGLVQLARGALPEACAAFHDAMSAMSHGFPSGWLMLVAAWCAQAEAARGNGAAAGDALRRAEETYGPHVAVFLPELELARAWERASVGETTAARMHAVRAAQIARRSEMGAVEMRARYTAVRFGDRSQAARLDELAKVLNTGMAEAIAVHAHGLAERDGDLLDVAANRFAEMGTMACAADATSQAAREHARIGHLGKQLAASTRAHWLAGKCEIRTPAVDAAARPLPLSDREREIAVLVAGGLSNRQMADRLCVSVRTVEGHLYRMFTKLGIERRDQLVHLVKSAKFGA